MSSKKCTCGRDGDGLDRCPIHTPEFPKCKVTIGVEFLGDYFETSDDEIDWRNICDSIYDLSADVEVEVRDAAEKRIALKAALKKKDGD